MLDALVRIWTLVVKDFTQLHPRAQILLAQHHVAEFYLPSLSRPLKPARNHWTRESLACMIDMLAICRAGCLSKEN